MNRNRTLLTIELRPIAGSRFQPTGFPDLGAAEFGPPDDRKLLVESAQSMANRFEASTWDEARSDQIDALAGIPYVKIVNPDGTFLSSSRLEAHRLASAYIMNGKIDGKNGEDWVSEQMQLQAGLPLDTRVVAKVCFALDPLSLIHGVFFARKNWPWQPKIARAVTSFIEASGIEPAVSGGVKRDSVINEAKGGKTAEGYGTVPHHRVEYTAKQIKAFVTVDHVQLRSYGLSDAATALLEAIIDLEIGSLFDRGLRLRTACDLEVVDVEGALPDVDAAKQRIAELVPQCASELGPITEITWSSQGKQ